MRACDYCGKENDEGSIFCAGCGCSLNEPKISLSIPWISFLSWGGLVVGILGTISIVFPSLLFFFVHNDLGPGVMILFFNVFEIGVITFLIGFPCAILAIKKGRSRIGWLGIFFALAPVPLCFAMVKLASLLNLFHLAD